MAAVLVTGGAGFIGTSLSSELVSQFDRVVVFDSLHPQIHPQQVRPEALDPKAELVIGDICDSAVWDQLLQTEPGFDCVIHLAAETGTGQSLTESTRHGMANVVGTTTMMDAFVRHQKLPKHIVLTSSRAVYGEGGWADSAGRVVTPPQRTHERMAAGIWTPELPAGDGWNPIATDAAIVDVAPASVYAATKLAQEHLLKSWAAAMGVDLSIFRLQNVYGPGQSPSNPYTGIIVLFHQLAAAGQTIEVYEDGDIVRDFVLIDDVASALLAGVDKPANGVRTIDVGSGMPTTILEAARAIAALYGAPEPQICGKFRDGDIRHAVASTKALAEELGVEAKFTFEEGSRLVSEWLRKLGLV